MTCLHCSAPTSGLALCARCDQTLRVGLANVAAYYRDVLRITPGRRVKVRSAYRSTPPATDTPRVDAVTRVTLAVDGAVSGWCRMLADDRPEAGPHPGATPEAVEWLDRHRASIATLEWAGELLRDMLDAERRLRAVLDRADTGWYAGACGNLLGEWVHDASTCACACHETGTCDLDCHPEDVVISEACERGLYASPGNAWVTCPACGRTWATAERRAAMITEARERVAPASVIARLVVGWDDEEPSVERMRKRINQWQTRGHLTRATTQVHDGQAVPAYRIGDVLDLLSDTPSPVTVAAAE